MQAIEVKSLLEKNIPDALVLVAGEGCDFQITVISDIFEGLSTVKRQKEVYLHLGSFITDGSIHAVSIKALTHSEWDEQNENHSEAIDS